MTLRKEITDQIESLRFSVELGVASTDAVFQLILEAHPGYQLLWKALTEDPLAPESVLSRITRLATADFDRDFRNPADTALAAYTWSLRFRPAAAQEARRAIARAANVHWAHRIARRTEATGDVVDVQTTAGFEAKAAQVSRERPARSGSASTPPPAGFAIGPTITGFAAAASVALVVSVASVDVRLVGESAAAPRDSQPTIRVATKADGTASGRS